MFPVAGQLSLRPIGSATLLNRYGLSIAIKVAVHTSSVDGRCWRLVRTTHKHIGDKQTELLFRSDLSVAALEKTLYDFDNALFTTGRDNGQR